MERICDQLLLDTSVYTGQKCLLMEEKKSTPSPLIVHLT